MKKFVCLGLVTFILTIVGPILFAQFRKTAPRKFTGAKLEEANYREITFNNDAAGLHLGGMLFTPEGNRTVPAVVIIPGSGGSHRNNRWYLTLTRYLQENGIAVLIPDKRGCDQSSGNWRNASFDDLARDAIAPVSFLKSEGRFQPLGVIGMSQGGEIAPIVALKCADVAFVVNVVGSSVPMHDSLLYEENYNLREIGLLPGISNLVARVSTFYLRKFGQADFWKAIGNFDPLPYWRKINVPCLVLYGGDDTNVPSKQSAERLTALKRTNLRVLVFEGSGHALECPIGQGTSIFRQDALRQVADFINSHRVSPLFHGAS